ncbi:helix-turn-helix domain-containing protein [Chryseobacterium sediminis]|uniref:Helix-turn-helix domain-containing protein n=1 Tax=Chryseobacterium sediminis TaxID=1679494 RepID=A0A5B2TTE0_9FLAO|nr:helix-turn-helix domain-containing protein [Chryseobacterium sediminis]KAA2217634.1 helix-turn-helix domain-containing protein [Chryseobacterium sediminis]
MKQISLLLFTFLYSLFFTQNRIDSLRLWNFEELKNKFTIYDEANKKLEARAVSQYYLTKAKKQKNILEIAEGYNLIHLTEDFPLALKYIDSLAMITKNVKGDVYPARTFIIKGNLYYKYDNLKAALDNYILGLEYSKKHKNLKQIAYANMNIAYLNSYMGRNKEAAKTFRYHLLNSQNITDEYQHDQMRVSLVYCYLKINKIDSANFFIQEGLNSPFVQKNKYNMNQYLYLSGQLNLTTKNYQLAIAELTKAYTYFSSINDNNQNYVLYSLGKCYEGLNNKQETIKYFTQIDANIKKTNITFPELGDVYTFLIDYYRESGDKEKQLYYIDRFLKVDKKLNEQFRYLSTELHQKYDTPNLLQEKEDIINELKNKKTFLYVSVSILILILFFLTYFYYKSKKAEKKHQKIAQNLIHLIEKRSPETIQHQNGKQIEIYQSIKDESGNKTNKTIPEEVVQSILKDLDTFENKLHFLKNGITLTSLAKNIKTNTGYLSEIINNHKDKNFTTYLNDLRIDYVLDQLVQDKKFRSYKLPVIAEEIGYNNVQAFSIAFKKRTGTTPSIYIKEIEKSISN